MTSTDQEMVIASLKSALANKDRQVTRLQSLNTRLQRNFTEMRASSDSYRLKMLALRRGDRAEYERLATARLLAIGNGGA